ncbi:uncharacterized protein [Struthio camelus]|uniref:uncharacterized protein isoform X3 n=2 Tax=Struthio camelus TaxID=8801 RepID=UPI003603B8A8
MRSSRPAQSTKQSCAAALCCRVRAGEAAPCCRVLAALLQTCPCGKRLVANGERDFFPAAQICPEETIVFLYCKLRSRSKADRVAAVEVLQALVRSAGQWPRPEKCSSPGVLLLPLMSQSGPALHEKLGSCEESLRKWGLGLSAHLSLSLAATETREKLPLFAKLVQSVCGDPTVQVQMAVLHFIGELLRSSAPGCSAWDVVAHIFSEFSRASGRLVRAERDAQAAFRVPAVPRCRGCRWQRGAGRSRSSAALAWPCIHRAPRGLGRGSDGCFPPLSRRRRGSLCAVEAREERAVQRLCGHVLGTLDVSAGGVAKLLWPRLLRHVVPAQHAGMLVPLCRCLCALAERQESAEREEEEVASEALEPVEQAPLPAPQALLARLLVSSWSPGKELLWPG